MFEANEVRTPGQRCIHYIIGFLLGTRNDTESVPGVLVFSRVFKYTVLYFDVRGDNKILGVHLVVFFKRDDYAADTPKQYFNELTEVKVQHHLSSVGHKCTDGKNSGEIFRVSFDCSIGDGYGDLHDVSAFSQVAQQLSPFDGCSRSQPSATHAFSENLKRSVDSNAFDRYSLLYVRNVKPRCLAICCNSKKDKASDGFGKYSQLCGAIAVADSPHEFILTPGSYVVHASNDLYSRKYVAKAHCSASTNAVNIGVDVHLIGDGLNETARSSDEGIPE
nr:hypothetical protein [Tanacetum cinerariifolium]